MRLVAASLCPRSAEGPCAPGTPPRLVRALFRGGPRGRIRVPPSRPNTRPEASPLYTVAWKGRDTYLAPNTKRLKRLSNLLNVAELVRGPRQSAAGVAGVIVRIAPVRPGLTCLCRPRHTHPGEAEQLPLQTCLAPGLLATQGRGETFGSQPAHVGGSLGTSQSLCLIRRKPGVPSSIVTLSPVAPPVCAVCPNRGAPGRACALPAPAVRDPGPRTEGATSPHPAGLGPQRSPSVLPLQPRHTPARDPLSRPRSFPIVALIPPDAALCSFLVF